MKKTELRVAIFCAKCKKQVLKAVAKLEGVDEVKVDSQKGMMTVVGSVDPVLVAKQLRKAGKYAEIISVGPNKKEVEQGKVEKGKGEKGKGEKEKVQTPKCCKQCELVGITFVPYYDGSQICSIL